MIRDDVLYLISENPEAHGIFSPPTETQRMVYCQVESVSRYEFWRGKENGLTPEIAFRLSDWREYQDEKICMWNGKRYRIIRNYVDGYAIELICGAATIDHDPPPSPTEPEEAAADG